MNFNKTSNVKQYVIGLAIIAFATILYWPSLDGTWLWDDNASIYPKHIDAYVDLGRFLAYFNKEEKLAQLMDRIPVIRERAIILKLIGQAVAKGNTAAIRKIGKDYRKEAKRIESPP